MPNYHGALVGGIPAIISLEIELIRQSARTNMLDKYAIRAIALDLGYDELVQYFKDEGELMDLLNLSGQFQKAVMLGEFSLNIADYRNSQANVPNYEMWAIEDLHAEHKRCVTAFNDAVEALGTVANEYNSVIQSLINSLKVTHPELVNLYNSKVTAKQEAEEALTHIEAIARRKLSYHKIQDLPQGYSQIRRKRYVISDMLRFKKAALKYAEFFVSIDDKRLKKFITDNAVETAQGSFELPTHYQTQFPMLTVEYDWVGEISKKHFPTAKGE